MGETAIREDAIGGGIRAFGGPGVLLCALLAVAPIAAVLGGAPALRNPVELKYAVYPSYGRLRVRVDLGALPSRDRVTGARVSFGREGDARPMVDQSVTFEGGVADHWFTLPELAAGDYEVRVALAGEGVPTAAVTGSYERRVFPWERNRFGLSRRVVPPFTPIEVEGAALRTILREHALGASGVWDQVTSLGQPLLKGPMRWVAVVDGRRRTLPPGRVRVMEREPDRVVTECDVGAGAGRMVVTTVWDYDGLAKVRVRLPGETDSRSTLDRLSLEIPLDDAKMTHLHACGDWHRFNYAGRVPAGHGPVWDSSKANRDRLVGTFYPYVWVGGGERGLLYCADTDRGWSSDGRTPAVQLERRRGVLTMRVNFITRPTRLSGEREFEFALQATPAKPMAERPVDWRRWFCRRIPEAAMQPFAILGSHYAYGCRSFDFYPVGHGLDLYDAFSRARDTGQADLSWVERWMGRYGPEPAPGSREWRLFHDQVEKGMRSAAAAPRSQGWLWAAYTNPRGVGRHMDEWPTFQDEWVKFPWQERSRRGEMTFELTPSGSFQDRALWSYREMLTCFDGIYWDSLLLSADTNPVAGGAWTDEQGQVHPSMGLWAMRDLVRRTAVMMDELGRPASANVVHHTNANLVPVQSFAGVSLDGEWRFGKGDWQDRFDPDLMVAESLGRQAGNLPLVLAGGFHDAGDPAYPFCMRTRTGVCAVHEIRVWDGSPQDYYELYRKLFDFGYGGPGCRVYNYWEAGFPLEVDGVDGKALVVVNGARAVVIVTDYGRGGACALTLDARALGLPAPVRASDLETGEPIPVARGTARFPLKRHDYRAVLFE